MGLLELRCLGSFALFVGETRVDTFRSHKERALLAYLAVECGRTHRRDHLAELLWSGSDRSDARRNLRLTLHRLRDHLPAAGLTKDFIAATRDHIRVDPQQLSVDIHQFEALLEPCAEMSCTAVGVCPDCESDLLRAVELYRGDFLPDLLLQDARPFMEWVLVTRERLQRKAIAVMHRLSDSERRRGNLEAARQLTERQLQLAPWREEAHRQLMDLLARGGERSAALAQFERCKREMRRRLDVEPSPATAALARRIRSAQASPPPALPQPATSFIGRAEELDELQHTLARREVRLLTIVGVGGVGKTRLALALARRIQRAYLDGVYFCSFDSATNEDRFWSALSDGLGLQQHSSVSVPDQVTDILAGREALVLLDSFEAALPHAKQLVRLLDAAPELELLVTSQAPLKLKQEQVFPLRGLTCATVGEAADEGASDGDRFFISVVQRKLAEWQPAPAELEHIGHICRDLDGWPLALEMAAARFPDQSLAAIRRAVSRAPAELGHLPGAPARQRSLRAVYQYAMERLDPAEQRTLVKLSVFEGSFTRDAAQQALDASPRALAALRWAALLQRRPQDRFALHPTLLSFAHADLAAEPERARRARQAHSNFFLSLLEDSRERLRGIAQPATIAALDRDWRNLTEAWRLGVQERVFDSLAGAALPLAHYCRLRGRMQTGARLLAQAVRACHAAGAEAQSAGARLRLAWAFLLNDLGRFQQARRELERARGQLDPSEQALSLCVRSRASMRQGDNDHALACAEQAREQYQQLDDSWGAALAAHHIATATWEHAPLQEVVRAQERAFRAAQAAGDPHLIGLCQNNLAAAERKLGNRERARQLLEPLVEAAEASQDSAQLAWPHVNLALLEHLEGNFTRAASLLRQALDSARVRGARLLAARARYALAVTLHTRGDDELALQHAHKAAGHLTRLGDTEGAVVARLTVAEILIERGSLQAARELLEKLSQDSERLGFAYGRAMIPVRLSQIAIAEGDCARARRLVLKALDCGAQYGPRSAHRLSLLAGVHLLLRFTETPEAERWLGALVNSPELSPMVQEEVQRWNEEAGLSVEPGDGEPSADLEQVEQGLRSALAQAF